MTHMATSNIKKKIAALSELRKDPAAAIARAFDQIKKDLKQHLDDVESVGEGTINHHDSDVDLVEQILSAVVADIVAERAPKKAGDAALSAGDA